MPTFISVAAILEVSCRWQHLSASAAHVIYPISLTELQHRLQKKLNASLKLEADITQPRENVLENFQLTKYIIYCFIM